MSGSYLVEAERVSKSFALGETTVQALIDVSLRVPAGGMTALMGPSGSGKSTLLNLFGALDRPTAGRVLFDGRDLATLTQDGRAAFRNDAIGFIFQNFNLIPVLTAYENVMLPHQLGGKSVEGEAAARAYYLLERVGLGPQANQSVNRLSGGQMQRVSVARALMNRPRLILADEPTANLDRDTADRVLQILKELCIGEGASIVVATHDHAVLTYCQRVVSMRDGRIITDELRTGF